MSASKIFALGAFGLVVGVVGWSGVVPHVYDGLVNGVTVLRTHTVYIEGVPESQKEISIWRIRLPDGIPRSSQGAVLFNDFDKDGRGKYYDIGVAGWLKDDKIISNPTDNRKHDFSAEYFAIEISNGLLEHTRFSNENYCISEDDARIGTSCTKNVPDCIVYMNYHGWNAYAGVPRETLYKTPDFVCKILRKNLDAWTISIDDLRQPQRVESK